MKNLLKVLLLAAMVSLAAACGSSGSSSSDDTPQISTVDGLPRATSPVVTNSSGSISAPKGMSAAKAAATTGVALSGMTSSTFTTGDSMDLCQAANQTRKVVNNAAMADLMLCYVQNIVASDASGQLADIYDGSYHVFGLSMVGGEEGTPDHVKMKIVKTGDAITGFEMFACSGGSQLEYLSQTISSNTVSIVSKGFYAGQNGSGGHQIEVSGTLNSTGYFTAKTMELDQYGGQTQGSPTQWSEATVAQYADKIVFNGYDSGSWQGSDFQNRVYSEYELIDGNSSAANSSYDIGLIAVGHGAAHGIFSSGSWSGSEQSLGWNADTKLGDNTVTIGSTSTTWVSQVEATDPRAVSTIPTIAFTGSQVYNCADTEEVEVTVNETALQTACSKLNLGQDWIDCFSSIRPDQQ